MKPNKKGQKVNKTINKFEFNGPIQNSNLSLQSNKASQQNISNMNNTEIMEKILELINQDKSISKANKEELKFDIDIINREMKKDNPRIELVKSYLSNFANIASIASFVQQLLLNIGQ